MSLLYSTNFKFSNDEMKKYPDFMDLDSTNNHHFQQEHHSSDGLVRHSSAPTSLFANLVDGTEGLHPSNNQDYRLIRSSSPEVEVILSRFMALCNETFDSGSVDRAVKLERVESAQQQNGFFNPSSSMVNTSSNKSPGGAQIGNSFGVMNSSDFNNLMQLQPGARNSSNLFRQSSSPAEFFSHLTAENGNMSRQYEDDFLSSSWHNSAARDLKRGRDNNGHTFSTSIVLETQNADSENNIRGLAHHLSLPITFNNEPVEKFLRFQDPVRLQSRAKRGCATHPRSIAERNRRTRISDRMKKLQELFPDMDKQTSKAEMLELAVEYIKGLQRQIKTLTDTKSKCACLRSSQ